MTTKKRVAAFLGLVVGLYMLSYIVLSPFGKYAVSGWHLIGQHGPWPMDYHWAPPGFYDPVTGEWRQSLVYLYLPLWTADGWFWHTRNFHPELSHSPAYPAVFPTSASE